MDSLGSESFMESSRIKAHYSPKINMTKIRTSKILFYIFKNLMCSNIFVYIFILLIIKLRYK